jgi:hypothetical protein
MSRICTVCAHPQRPAIDAALVAGEPNRRIATQYAFSEASVRRHRAKHIPKQLAQAVEAEELSQADKLLAEVKRRHSLALAMLVKAGNAGDLRTALAGVREARGCLELEAKIRGQLDERPMVNVWLDPEWRRALAALMLALAPYAEARQAASQALMMLDSGGGGSSRELRA